jgi:hypothetical protein
VRGYVLADCVLLLHLHGPSCAWTCASLNPKSDGRQSQKPAKLYFCSMCTRCQSGHGFRSRFQTWENASFTRWDLWLEPVYSATDVPCHRRYSIASILQRLHLTSRPGRVHFPRSEAKTSGKLQFTAAARCTSELIWISE